MRETPRMGRTCMCGCSTVCKSFFDTYQAAGSFVHIRHLIATHLRRGPLWRTSRVQIPLLRILPTASAPARICKEFRRPISRPDFSSVPRPIFFLISDNSSIPNFVRKVSWHGRAKVRIVGSFREKGGPHRRVVKHVGTTSGKVEFALLMSNARFIKELLEGQRRRRLIPFDSKDCADLIEQNRRAGSSERKSAGVDALETAAEKPVTVGVREAFGITLEEFDCVPPSGGILP